jgi:acyl-CoA thioesterase FadM
MEECEHALWRAAGLTIAHAGEETGWPRLAATFEFKAPLRFEDEFEVLVDIAALTRCTVLYTFTIERGDTLIGTGTLTTAHVTRRPGEPMKALDLPPDIIGLLQAALRG